MAGTDELPIPSAASDDAGSAEVLRAWVANQGLHVSLRPAFDDPGMWGVLLVDVARHVARMCADEKMCSEADALKEIRRVFDSEWERPTDPGSTEPAKPQ